MKHRPLKRATPACPRRLAAGLALAILVVGASALFGDRQLVVNTSQSVPPGLYVRTARSPTVGALVDFVTPPAARAYIFSRTGRSGDDWYILKPIIAGPGDHVDTTRDWLWVNGGRIAPMPPNVDGADRPLPVWRARRRLADDEYFVFSSRISNSFDSRCYGPLRRDQIAAVRRALITW